MQNLLRSLTTVALIALCLASSGCQTLSSIGLPVACGPYQLNESAKRISQSHTQAAALPRELSEAVMPVYIVEPGDILYLEPAKFNSEMRLPSDQPVQPDGSIEVGRYGRVRVAGLTIPQVRRAVEAAIESIDGDKAEDVIVRLVDWKSKVFYVIGEVNSPGAYPYTGGENVLDAIVAAGDITRRANRHQIILSRPTGPCDPRIVLPICYDNVIQLGDSSSNYQIQPGDRIFVPGITFIEDVMQSVSPHSNERCPSCAPLQRGQPIPTVDCCGHTRAISHGTSHPGS